MTPDELVEATRLIAVEENVLTFRRLFSDTLPAKASDPYWQRALALFNRLESADQEVFLEVVRNTAIATTSTVLGIVDGAHINSIDDSRLVLLDASGKQLNGDLRELFLHDQEMRASKALGG